MRVEDLILKTSNGNTYIYLPQISEYSYIGQSDFPYNETQIKYFQKKGLLKFNKPKLCTIYNPDLLEENLANLRQLLIEVTDGCNLNCKYCGYGDYYSNYDPRQNKKISFKDVKGLIDYLVSLWISDLNLSHDNEIVIGFYGGEPLLNFDIIYKTIKYLDSLIIKNIKFSYNMTTNAMLLDKYMDFLAEKKFKLMISLDGNEINDSYRVTSSGKSSFKKVYDNINKLMIKHNEYFNKYVMFNSVLHNRNSVEEASTFIWKAFGKIPIVSELNTNGIVPEKRKEFFNMFRNKEQNYSKIENCDLLKEMQKENIGDSTLNMFLDSLCSNTFMDYRDLFKKEETEYIPTGTCVPFERKIFLTVNGKILPCERIGQEISLGKVENGKVKINFHEVSKLYENYYNDITFKCKVCSFWKNCGYCIHYIPKNNGKKTCDRFRPQKYLNKYQSINLSKLEKNYSLFSNYHFNMKKY